MSRVFETMGSMGATVRIATTNTATALLAAILEDSSRKATAATISIETANVRIAFRATPTVGATGLGHILWPGDSWRIVGRENLEQFKHISAATDVPGAIVLTPEY